MITKTVSGGMHSRRLLVNGFVPRTTIVRDIYLAFVKDRRGCHRASAVAIVCLVALTRP